MQQEHEAGREAVAPSPPGTWAGSRGERRAAACVAAACAGLFLWESLAHALPRLDAVEFDDAYMFVRYANNILAGDGWSWNAEDGPAWGSTSVLHQLVVLGARAVAPGAGLSPLLGWCSLAPGLLAGLLLAWVAGRGLAQASRLSPLWGAVVLAPMGFTTVWEVNLLNGMDTMLATVTVALAVLGAWRLLDRPTAGRAAASAGLGLLAFLARPDSGLLAFGLPALLLLAGTGGRERWRALGVLCGASAAGLALYAGAGWLAFGSPVPYPFFAKSAGAQAGYLGAWKFNPVTYLWEIGSFLALPGAVLGATMHRGRGAALAGLMLLPVLATWLYFFSVLQIMGHGARFYLPSTPLVIGSAAWMAGEWLALGPRLGAMQAARVASGALVAIMLAAPLPVKQQAAEAYRERFLMERPARGWPALSLPAGRPAPLPRNSWLTLLEANHVAGAFPPGTSIAAGEHGLLAAANPGLHVIDTLGLHDREFALEGFSAARLLEREPDVIWMPTANYSRHTLDLVHHPGFQQGYDFYMGVLAFGVAVRRDSPRREAIMHALKTRWEALHPGLQLEDYLVTWGPAPKPPAPGG